LPLASQFFLSAYQHGGISTSFDGTHKVFNRTVHGGEFPACPPQVRSDGIPLLGSGHGLSDGFLKRRLIGVETVKVAQGLFL
jgi:hypothetical protein